jgi:RND family efflux transporter MFP subunit
LNVVRDDRGRLRPLRFLFPVLVLVAAAGGALLLVLTKPTPQAAPAEERRFAIRTVTAKRSDFQPRIRHYGRLVASREVQLEAAVAGRVLEISERLRPGGELRAGETIVRLDPAFYESELRQLEAARVEAQAALAGLEVERLAAQKAAEVAQQQLALAERERERQRNLIARRVASEKTVEAAEAAVLQRREALIETERRRDTLEQEIVRQRAAIDRLKAQISWAERQLADTVVRAPFDAIVAEVQVMVGRELRAHDPIARIYATDDLEIAFSLADSEFGRLWQDGLLGRDIVAEWQLGGVVYGLRGRVSRIGERVDRTAAGVPVYATVTAKPAGVPLRPDAFLTISIPDVSYSDVFVLPRTALYDGQTVYVVENERLVARPVEPVARGDGMVAVRGGLADGELVLVTRLAEAGPGLRVRVVP